jgi:hypothetical protein
MLSGFSIGKSYQLNPSRQTITSDGYPHHRLRRHCCCLQIVEQHYLVGRHARMDQVSTASIKPGPCSASARMSASASSPSVCTLQAGMPNPFASATQSIAGRVRSVSAHALGPGSAIPGAGKLGLQNPVATVCAHHDGHVCALPRHRPERLQRVQAASVGLKRDDPAGPDMRARSQAHWEAPGQLRHPL